MEFSVTSGRNLKKECIVWPPTLRAATPVGARTTILLDVMSLKCSISVDFPVPALPVTKRFLFVLSMILRAFLASLSMDFDFFIRTRIFLNYDFENVSMAETRCIICGKPVGENGFVGTVKDMKVTFCEEHVNVCKSDCESCVYYTKCKEYNEKE